MVSAQIPNWLKGHLNNEDLTEIKNLVAELEKQTSGEVVPMIVRNSSTIGHLPYVLIPTLLILDLISGFWEFTVNIHATPVPLMFLLHAILILIFTMMLSRLPILHRLLTPKLDQKFQVEQRAIKEFYEHKVHYTESQTGILIFISMMEKMAVVIGDEKINSLLNPQDWENVLHQILKELKSGNLKLGISNGLISAKDLLAKHFPIQNGDKNELPNELIIKE